MKKILNIIVATALFFSCNEDINEPVSGKVIYKINFTNQQISISKANQVNDTLYSQFGDYIASLTPFKFTAHIWTVGYIDKVLEFSNNNANMLQYIEQNGEKLPFNDSSRYIDFSNNNVVTFNPVVYGRVNNDRIFEDPQINFIYFYFIPFSMYQEVQLPDQYQNVQLNMFPFFENTDNILRVTYFEMAKKIFPDANVNTNIYFIFGNTDSTFVVNSNGETVQMSENCPIAQPGNNLVIRSNNYSNMIFNSPVNGSTVVMNGVLSFNTENLIQVYAGNDNIPYTSDDIFIYAPKFWERIYSRLDVN